MRRLAVALALIVVASGCAATTESPVPGDVSVGPTLRAGAVIFDPVAEDVAGTEVCDGRSGRDELEVFDRSGWPALDVAAGEAMLLCGNADGSGWRHIADGHTDDFGELADEVGSSWEDVAWFAIDQALEAPTVVEPYRSDIVNYDVRIELVDESGQVERAWLVTVGYGLGSGQIITAFPDERDR